MNRISRKKKIGIWLLMIPIAIYILSLSIEQIINQPLDIAHFGPFLLLTILIAAFPIRMQDKVFNLLQGVSLSALLIFGLLPELLLSFIGILVILIRSKVDFNQHYRYPINILATWTSSFISAGAYYLSIEMFGITWTEPYYILSMAVYLATYNIVNQVLSVIVGKYFYNLDNIPLIDEDAFFSFKVMLILLPSSFIVVFLHEMLGAQGIISAAFPFVAISIVTRYYYQSKTNNQYLHEIAKYSQKLAKKKDKKSVIKDFMDYILKIFPAKQVYYFTVVHEKFGVLDNVSVLEGQKQDAQPEIILTEKSPLMEAFYKDKTMVFHQATDWRNQAYYNHYYCPESVITLPIKLQDKYRGLIVITHPQRKVYDDLLTSLIGMFYQYFRNVLETIDEFEVLEDSNNTDYLTELPNLRGFYNYFEKINKRQKYDTLSLIVLDLDHFKKINDKHGHGAGNDVLVQVANVLSIFSNKNVFIARFGGEEFILLVQNLSKEEAYQLTENIRKAIERKVFKVDYSIETGAATEVRATASFGLATYPDDVNEIHSLVQLADRAMYLGSKQNGRNKITVHEEER